MLHVCQLHKEYKTKMVLHQNIKFYDPEKVWQVNIGSGNTPGIQIVQVICT